MFKKLKDNFIRFGIRAMFWSVSHGHAVLVAKEIIYGNGMIEWNPSVCRVGRAARYFTSRILL